METPQVRFARLDKAKIAKIHELEEFLGTYVLAFEPVIKIAALAQSSWTSCRPWKKNWASFWWLTETYRRSKSSNNGVKLSFTPLSIEHYTNRSKRS